MKFKILMAALLAFTPITCLAQDDNEDSGPQTVTLSYSPDDTDIEFENYKDGDCKIELKKNKLIIESKKKGKFSRDLKSAGGHYVIAATSSYKFNPAGADFSYSAPVKFDNFDDKHVSGIVFDYRNENSFQALVCDKKNFYYIVCRDGEITIEEKGEYKSKRKDNTITPKVEVKNRKITFSIDGIEMGSGKIARKVKSKKFGFCTNNESRIEVKGPIEIGVTYIDSDDEDSDDDSDRRSRRRRSYDEDDD